mmetsp:Transcript_18678/g.40151  ORF Transcript_18678/g.40151 Transcript_18678/m.40151 type:complete len:331 (-) Transcript_18678:210-1202(-)
MPSSPTSKISSRSRLALAAFSSRAASRSCLALRRISAVTFSFRLPPFLPVFFCPLSKNSSSSSLSSSSSSTTSSISSLPRPCIPGGGIRGSRTRREGGSGRLSSIDCIRPSPAVDGGAALDPGGVAGIVAGVKAGAVGFIPKRGGAGLSIRLGGGAAGLDISGGVDGAVADAAAGPMGGGPGGLGGIADGMMGGTEGVIICPGLLAAGSGGTFSVPGILAPGGGGGGPGLVGNEGTFNNPLFPPGRTAPGAAGPLGGGGMGRNWGGAICPELLGCGDKPGGLAAPGGIARGAAGGAPGLAAEGGGPKGLIPGGGARPLLGGGVADGAPFN